MEPIATEPSPTAAATDPSVKLAVWASLNTPRALWRQPSGTRFSPEVALASVTRGIRSEATPDWVCAEYGCPDTMALPQGVERKELWMLKAIWTLG